MDKDKYTWEDLIFNPTTEESKSAIGKEVYYSDKPSYCINYANENNKEFLGILDGTEKSNNPFHIKESVNWACIIVKKKPSYEECAKQWIEENNLKEGDCVKVLRKAKDFESGWDATWNDLMNKSVCKILKITEVRFCNGHIILEDGYRYPYFVLEKVEPPKPEYVPFESKEEFIEAYHYHDNANYSETEDILMNYGMWLKDKNSHEIFLVTGVFNQSIHICDFDNDESWGELLNEFTFIDGIPCGKSMEE